MHELTLASPLLLLRGGWWLACCCWVGLRGGDQVRGVAARWGGEVGDAGRCCASRGRRLDTVRCSWLNVSSTSVVHTFYDSNKWAVSGQMSNA